MTLGEKIRKLRKEKHMTLEEVGDICGVSRQNIYRYEHGLITNLPLERVEKLSNALGCSPAYLMGWTDDPEGKTATNDSDGLSDRINLLVKMFDRLSPDGQEAVLQTLIDQLKAGK